MHRFRVGGASFGCLESEMIVPMSELRFASRMHLIDLRCDLIGRTKP